MFPYVGQANVQVVADAAPGVDLKIEVRTNDGLCDGVGSCKSTLYLNPVPLAEYPTAGGPTHSRFGGVASGVFLRPSHPPRAELRVAIESTDEKNIALPRGHEIVFRAGDDSPQEIFLQPRHTSPHPVVVNLKIAPNNLGFELSTDEIQVVVRSGGAWFPGSLREDEGPEEEAMKRALYKFGGLWDQEKVEELFHQGWCVDDLIEWRKPIDYSREVPFLVRFYLSLAEYLNSQIMQAARGTEHWEERNNQNDTYGVLGSTPFYHLRIGRGAGQEKHR